MSSSSTTGAATSRMPDLSGTSLRELPHLSGPHLEEALRWMLTKADETPAVAASAAGGGAERVD